MYYIEADQAFVEDFVADFPEGKPVVMLNLLNFSERANYQAEHNMEPCSGFEAFMRYGAGVTPLIAAAGGEQVWQGRPAAMLIGPQDKDWNLAVLVRYPSARAFLEMVSSPEYQAISFHRAAALRDSRLIAHEEL